LAQAKYSKLLPSLERSAMTSFTTTLTFALALLCADARLHREEPAAPAPAAAPGGEWAKLLEEASAKCKELCKVDTGMDADARDCLTECATSTDLMTHHLDQGFEDFARDESYNEKGGNQIKELHNENATDEVPECAPTVDLTKVPQFGDLDTNGDGKIDFEESALWNEKACVPDEMAEQIFSEADLNQDKVIDEAEFKDAGEDTAMEEAMDKGLEEASEGDDEYNSVQNPPLEEFDENKDGALDESEAKDVFEHEMHRRTEHEEVPAEAEKDLEPEIKDAIDKVDTNDDGEISGDEYVAKNDDGSDLGQELSEAADADEDAKELDDLSRTDGAAAAAPAAAASFAQHRRHRNAAFLHKRKASRKYAMALQQVAQAKHWLREAQMLQKEAALNHHKAALNRRKATLERHHH